MLGLKRRVLPHRHTGMVLGAGAQFRCTSCGEWCWQPKDTTRIIRALEFAFITCSAVPSRDWTLRGPAYVKAERERHLAKDRESHRMAVAMADRLAELYPADARRHAKELAELRDWDAWQAKNVMRRAESITEIIPVARIDSDKALMLGIASPVEVA